MMPLAVALITVGCLVAGIVGLIFGEMDKHTRDRW